MPQQIIDTGATANDGTGDPLRDAFIAVNAMMTELYGAVGAPFSLAVPIGGADAAIEVGEVVSGVRVPVAATLTAAYLDLDAAGDLSVEVARAPEATPNTYAALFTVSATGAQNASSTSLAHAFSAGDRLAVEVTGTPATATSATLNLSFTRA